MVAIEESFHELDASGDIELVFNTHHDQTAKGENARQAKTENNDSASDCSLREIRIRASSKHLSLASPYFKRMLEGRWLEGDTLRSNGYARIPIDDWDPDAFLILVNILHCHTRKVPRQVDLEMLTKLAVLIDYYECHEAVEVFSDMWIDGLKKCLPTTYSKDLISWLFISWVFRKSDQFKEMTLIALRQSTGLIEKFGLQIRDVIVEAIDQQREKLFSKILLGLTFIRDNFHDHRCSFECDSIMLGALTKEVKSMGLLPHPEPPFAGFSLENVTKGLHSIRSPRWYSSPGSLHGCKLTPGITLLLNTVETGIRGLDLEIFL